MVGLLEDGRPCELFHQGAPLCPVDVALDEAVLSCQHSGGRKAMSPSACDGHTFSGGPLNGSHTLCAASLLRAHGLMLCPRVISKARASRETA